MSTLLLARGGQIAFFLCIFSLQKRNETEKKKGPETEGTPFHVFFSLSTSPRIVPRGPRDPTAKLFPFSPSYFTWRHWRESPRKGGRKEHSDSETVSGISFLHLRRWDYDFGKDDDSFSSSSPSTISLGEALKCWNFLPTGLCAFSTRTSRIYILSSNIQF